MRVSVDDRPFRRARIFLDGVEVKNVVAADEEAGTVMVLLLDHPVSEQHGYAKAVYTGKVEIREWDA